MEIRINRYTTYKHSSLNIFQRYGYSSNEYKLIHDRGKFEATVHYRKQTNYLNGNADYIWVINDFDHEDGSIVNYINEFIECLYDQIIYPKLKKIKIQDTVCICMNIPYSEYQKELANALRDSFASEVKMENLSPDDSNIILKVMIA